MLSNVTSLCVIEVLENWLEVDTLGLNGGTEFIENAFDVNVMVSEVLFTGKESVCFGDWLYAHVRIFINSANRESFVNALDEVFVIEENLSVVGRVLICKSIIFVVGKVEVHVGKN